MATTEAIPTVADDESRWLARHGAEKLWKLLAGCFEEVAMAITGGESGTAALLGSTEESQFRS